MKLKGVLVVLKLIKYTVIALAILVIFKEANLINYNTPRLQTLHHELIIMGNDFAKKAQKYLEELSSGESLDTDLLKKNFESSSK